jgi:hypothetical protein
MGVFIVVILHFRDNWMPLEGIALGKTYPHTRLT